MTQKLITKYNDFFNKEIENSTFIVLLISGLVIATGVFLPQKETLAIYAQGNVLGMYKDTKNDTVIAIEGVEYRIILEKVR